MVDDEVETSVQLGEGDQQTKERVPKVNSLKSSTEIINTLAKTKY